MLLCFVIWDRVWTLNVYPNCKNHIFLLSSSGVDSFGFSCLDFQQSISVIS